jgi:probable selenium-dependent hydroxylase accessory protein YqeC
MAQVYQLDTNYNFIETDFLTAFPFLREKGHVVSLVGAGGKSSLMAQMAEVCSAYGRRVLVSTTTHIWKPADGSFVESTEEMQARWQAGQYAVAGQEAPNGKLCMLPEQTLRAWMKQAELVFLEADGSKQRPMKAPAQGEPVLLPESDIVICVIGMSALGRPIREACFRLLELESLLGKEGNQVVTEQDMIRLFLSSQGGRKAVGNRQYYMVLNQCDDERKRKKAEQIMRELNRLGYENIRATKLGNGRASQERE